MQEKEQLTDEEKKAVRALKRLAKTFPKSLWLWSADGRLYIMKYSWSEMGNGMRKGDYFGGKVDEVDPDGEIESIEVRSSGGDW